MADSARDIRSPFDLLIGMEALDDDPDHARLRVPVRENLLQPFGLTHGGVMSTLVEGICSRSTALAVEADGMVAMGQSITVNFLRPITEGAAEVTAHARHRGRSTWVWDAEVTDDEGRVCAMAQMTIVVRPRPKS